MLTNTRHTNIIIKILGLAAFQYANEILHNGKIDYETRRLQLHTYIYNLRPQFTLDYNLHLPVCIWKYKRVSVHWHYYYYFIKHKDDTIKTRLVTGSHSDRRHNTTSHTHSHTCFMHMR